MAQRRSGTRRRRHNAISRVSLRGVSFLALVGLASFLPLGGCGDGPREEPRFSDETVEQLDGAIESQMRRDDLPGVAVGVWVPGEGEYVAARGKANMETGAAREPDDPFRAASITKTFVATAVLQLVDEGKLSRSDKLSRWYPEFPNADRITVEDLLRMRSGLSESYGPAESEEMLEDYREQGEDPLTGVSTADMIERAVERSEEEGHPPGRRAEYKNTDYVLLGEIVEEVSGEDLDTYTTRHMLEPLGMEDTTYPTTDELPGGLRGYVTDSSSGEPVDTTIRNPEVPAGAGAMISTIPDLGIWAGAVCEGELLEPGTHEARLKARPLENRPVAYGEGLQRAGSFCGHDGDISGFNSRMWYLPEREATIVVSVNKSANTALQSPSDELAGNIASIVVPEQAGELNQ